jgi:predicted transposase YdaD
MIAGIVAARQFELLPLGEMLAGLVFKDSADREELKRRFAVYKDIIEESWVYQEILQKGVEKGLQQGVQQGLQQGVQQGLQETLRRQRQAILGLLQKRFPELVDLTQKQLNSVTDPDALQDLVVKAGTAQNAKEILSALSEVSRQEKE